MLRQAFAHLMNSTHLQGFSSHDYHHPDITSEPQTWQTTTEGMVVRMVATTIASDDTEARKFQSTCVVEVSQS